MRTTSVLKQYRHIISSPTYFPLWLGQLVSSFGDTINYVALVVLVYKLSGSGLAVSATVVFEIVPVLLLAPVAGVVIDRFPRKTILVASDLTRAGLALVLVFADSTWQVYLVATLLTACSVFFGPTLQAIIPDVVEEESLLAANSVGWSTNHLVQIIASAIAGGMIATIGAGPAFGVNALSFVFSAIMILRLTIPTQPAHAGMSVEGADRGNRRGLSGWTEDLREGLRYARHDRFVSRMLLVQAMASFAVGATGALLVVLGERHLGLPPEGFAWLLLAIGAGALVGPVLSGSIIKSYRNVRYLFVPYVIRGVGDILIALVTPLPVALLILFVYGLNTSTGAVIYSSLMQSQVDEQVQGRVYTLMDLTWSLMRLISLGVGGALVDIVGVQVIYYVGGGLLVGSGLLGLILLRDYSFKVVPEKEPVAQQL